MEAGVVVMICVEKVRQLIDTSVNDTCHYIIVRCPSVTNPKGIYRCNLGSDRVISYQDTCNFTCSTSNW